MHGNGRVKVKYGGLFAIGKRRPRTLRGARRVLIVKPSALGDVVQALPLLDVLRANLPDAKIGWLVNRSCADIIADDPRLSELLVFERDHWADPRKLVANFSSLFWFFERLELARYDAVIDLQGLLRSGVMALATTARMRVGLSTARERSEMFYNVRIEVPDKRMHAVDRYLLVADALGLRRGEPVFDLHVDPPAAERVRERLPDAGAGPLVVITPGARWPSKLWPSKRFAAVADALVATVGARVVIAGAEGDRERARRVRSHMNREATNLAGETSLKELVALVAEADLLVTNDSGPMHVADALGTPLVAVFGPTDPARTGPYRQRDGVLRADDCTPACLRRRCADRKCLKAITADMVLQKARERLADATGCVAHNVGERVSC